MIWDIQRKDGRTISICDEIVTIKGFILSENKKELVIQTNTERVLVQKGSFRYDEIPKTERFFILAKIGDVLKLVDYL